MGRNEDRGKIRGARNMRAGPNFTRLSLSLALLDPHRKDVRTISLIKNDYEDRNGFQAQLITG